LIEKLNIRPHRGQLVRRDIHAIHCKVGSKDRYPLTVGRQDSLILDGLGRYDAMAAAPAFSVIGASSTAGGTGDTEDARYATSVQYGTRIGG
jgi:hypothetical protein